MTPLVRSASSPANRLYKFPSGVVIRLVTTRKDVLSHFDGEYGRLAIDQCDKPHLDVYAGNYEQVVASLASQGPDLLTHRGRHKTITWKIALLGLDDATTTVAFEGKGAMAVSFLQTFYLEPLLRFKVLQAGYALTHACTLIKGTKSVLFPGGSAVGKTTLALTQAVRGEAIQGDNYVIVSPEGETHAYSRRLRIYADVQRTNPDAYRRLPLNERLHLRLNSLIKRLSLGFANLPRRLNIDQFVPNYRIPPRAELDSVFMLVAHKGSELIGPTPIMLDQLIEKILAISVSEASRLTEIIAPYLAAHPESRLHSMVEIERDILGKALKDLPIFEILVPRVDNPGPLAGQLARISGMNEDASDKSLIASR